ncbi:peptidase-C39 like family protein [Desulforhopalus sp. IMCC35007]|uniref:peptidase-C39 like family protein n=1 Tax=Desulforhopalus sp. IMCC35007 TaxID=2569543 RepID=UPI0010ADFFAE|nr:peptidase-C39 like family protein [Desulforhopalus sp. IMCC35007]TKB09256.1 peptidase-C39 like family protein [Desulforhopalus sp. IMCC35007]
METQIHFEILRQPDDTTCGPTCLHSIYSYYNDTISLAQVIEEVPALEGGGTLAVVLGCHALQRGYDATLYTFDMQVFDPTWFCLSAEEMAEKLILQLEVKHTPKMETVTRAYLEFLRLKGKILLEDLSTELLRRILKQHKPIISGLSSTYLYRSARELDLGSRLIYDDINGEPTGHFVVLSGYDINTRKAMIADPWHPNPMSDNQYYEVRFNRLIPAIMLSTISFDANMLVITPRKKK